MSLVEENVIGNYAEEVSKALDGRLSEVILFGSYATDDYVPGSDVDIALIVTEEKPSDEQHIWSIAEEYSSKYNVEFSPKIFEKNFFEEKIDEGFSFYSQIDEEGIRL